MARSSASMSVLPVATAGMAKMIMKATTSCAQTNNGIRLSDMPGERILNTVTMTFTAATIAAISVNVTTCAHTSMRCPGEYTVDSGGYANQPASGPVLTKNETYMNTTPTRYVQ